MEQRAALFHNTVRIVLTALRAGDIVQSVGVIAMTLDLNPRSGATHSEFYVSSGAGNLVQIARNPHEMILALTTPGGPRHEIFPFADEWSTPILDGIEHWARFLPSGLIHFGIVFRPGEHPDRVQLIAEAHDGAGALRPGHLRHSFIRMRNRD